MMEKRSRSRGIFVVVLIVAVALPFIASRLGHQGKPPASARTPFSPKLVTAARIRIPGGLVKVATGEGGVWVTGFGVVTHVDPATNRVAAEIAVPGTGDYSYVAVGYGSVWVTAAEGRPGALVRIDPVKNRIAAIIEIGGPVGDVELFNGMVWVTRPESGSPTLFSIDPRTNRMVGKYPSNAPTSLRPVLGGSVRGFGSVWLAHDDVVLRMDPDSAEIQARIPVPLAADIAIGRSVVWVMTTSPSSSGDLYLPIPGRPGTILLIDPRTNRVSTSPLPFGVPPASMAVGDDSLWVGEYGGPAVLTRIKLEAPR
jgi:streptogramin lyase